MSGARRRLGRHGAHVEVERQRVRREGRGACGVAVHPPHVVAAAEHLVLDEPDRSARGVADDDLLPLDDHHPVDDAGGVGGLAPAPAQRLDLQQLHPVGELDEAARPGEELGPEVCGDPEGVHVDAELVDEAGQLLDLLGGVELRLVTDEVVHPDTLGEPFDDGVPEVEVVGDLDRRGRQAQPRGEHRLPHAVELGEDQPLPSAGGVVVVHLQGKGRLAAVHRSGEEHQFSHEATP